MPLSGTFLANKDASPQGYQPLLLAVFQFVDGTFQRWSTNPLTSSEGGFQYAGHNYEARIAQQDIAAVQSRSEQGIDRFPSVTLHLHNANQTLWAIEQLIGFKGAALTLQLVLFDIDPSTGAYLFTSDAPTRFTGICDAPSLDDGAATLTVTANNNHNLAKLFFPILHVQNRCINLFAMNAARRLAGASDMSAWEWGCGYNPDQACTDPEIGGDGRRGNTTAPNQNNPNGSPLSDAGGMYVSCDYTKPSCIARGMYSVDSTNRATGRFTAEQFAPVQRETQSKAYVEGKNVTVHSISNQSIYNESYPMLYGSQWIKPLVVNILGDGNSTRFECVLCTGDIGPTGVNQVVVNGVNIPANNGSNAEALFRWNFAAYSVGGGGGTHPTTMATGSRNGLATKDAGYNDSAGNPQGDPHGNVATIEVVVYRELADSNAIPSVDIWANGPKVKIATTSDPNDQATWPYLYTNNPVWILLDLLIWANYRYNELDLASFQDAATVCDVSIPYTDLHGDTSTHRRFMCEFFLKQRVAAQQIIAQVLQCCNGQLVPNSSTGLLQIFIRQTLADQQPAPVPGSNYNTAVASLHADLSTGPGFVAYLFDESTILRDSPDGAPKIRVYSTPNSDTPNRIGFAFQDSDNAYQQDSISIVDPDGVNRAGGYQGGQEVSEAFQVLGISNFDQAARIANVHLAERLRGNEGLPTGSDTRGSRYFEVEATSRIAHLRVGHICKLRYQQLSLDILVRVLKIQPRTNYETAVVTLQWHSDIWYTDRYGQNPAALNSNPLNNRPARPPYPWKPYGDQPQVGDSMFDITDWSFQVGEFYGAAADGTAIAQLAISGCPTVNTLSTTAQPPLFEQYQGTTANTGGTINDAQTVLIAISVQDASGLWSALSKFCSVTIPVGGTAHNTATTPDINWQPNTVAYAVFAGPDEQSLCFQAGGAGTPDNITLAALNTASYGPPDILFDHLVIRTKKVVHPGVWTAAVSAVDVGTLQFAGAAFDVDQWVDYDISLVSIGLIASTSTPVPRYSFRVVSNTADTLTVTPDPMMSGHLAMQAGFVFVMRAKADGSGAQAITGASNASPIVITIAGHGFVTGQNIAISGVLGNTAANGSWTITVIDADTFSLNGSAGNGVFDGSGSPTAASTTTINDANYINFYAPAGLTAEVGNRVRIIKGTGRGALRTIIANTATGFTVDRPWNTAPDATSRFIIEEASWQNAPDMEQLVSGVFVPAPIPNVGNPIVDNYPGATLLVQCETADSQGNLGIKRYAPLREIYIIGSPGNTGVAIDAVQVTY